MNTAFAPRVLGRFLREAWNFPEETKKHDARGVSGLLRTWSGVRLVWRPTDALIEFVG
jgi:hypothetical protein